MERLDKVDVSLADVLLVLNEDVLVAELEDVDLPERPPQAIADSLGELGVNPARKDCEVGVQHGHSGAGLEGLAYRRSQRGATRNGSFDGAYNPLRRSRPQRGVHAMVDI